MSDMVDICPECGGTDFRPRVGDIRDYPTKGDGYYRCSDCEACFPEPDTKPTPKNYDSRLKGPAQTLHEAELKEGESIRELAERKQNE